MSRSVKLIYTSDISYTIQSDVIIITENKKQISCTQKEQIRYVIDYLHGNPSIIQSILVINRNAVILVVRFYIQS